MDWLLQRFRDQDLATAFNENGLVTTYRDFAHRIDMYRVSLRSSGILSGDVVMLKGKSNSELLALILAGMSEELIVVPLTFDAPVTDNRAVDITCADWRCDLNSLGLDITRTSREASIRPKLMQTLTSEGLGGLVLFSSGSSGIPKGILYDRKKLVGKFEATRPPIRALSFLALDHFGGLNTCLSVLASGGEVIGLTDRRVDTVCQAVTDHKVKVLPVTPSFIRLLIASRAYERYDLSSLEKITYGTEPMTTSTLNRLTELFPKVELQQTYGLSEIGVLRSKSRPDGSLWMKIGGHGFEWKVVSGILWIRSDYQMRGYINAEAEFDSDGFFNTQDEVLVDGEFVRVLGRASDVINVGGEKIYPAEVENCIQNMNNIRQVVAYGVSNPLLGQVVAVDVVLEVMEDLANLRSRLRSHCQVHLGANKIPTKVRIVERIDVTPRQKTVRPKQSDNS